MDYKKGDKVRLKKDGSIWVVKALRGEDKPGFSFKELILRETEGPWAKVYVRPEFVEKVS